MLIHDGSVQQLLRSCCPQSCDAWYRQYLDEGFLCGKPAIVESNNKQASNHMVIPVPELGEFSAKSILSTLHTHVSLKLCMGLRYGCFRG